MVDDKRLAEEALKLAEAQGLSPFPRAFTVLYEVLRGENAQLKAAFEGLASENKLDDDTIEDLFDAHCSQQDPYTQANTRLARLLGKLAKQVRAGSTGTRDFSASLKGFTSRAEGVSGDELSILIAEIMAETEKMMEVNAGLEGRLIESAEEIEKLRTDLAAAQQSARLDGLTGLPNRREFDGRISRLTQQSKQTARPLCLVLVDIDHFKKFNDDHGHLVGDHVLRLVASVLKDHVRESDLAARFGGEEFAVLLPETDLPTAEAVANKLREAIKGKPLKDRRTGESIGRVTASLGVSQYIIGEEVRDFIERSDDALYEAKSSGRDKVCTERKLGR